MLTPFSDSHIDTEVNALFEQTLQQCNKRKPLLISPNTMSYGNTINEVQTVMQLFANKGLQCGDSVVLSLENDADMLVFFLAAFRYGLITTTIDIYATNHEVSQLFSLVNAKAVVCSVDIYQRWSEHHIIPSSVVLTVPVAARTKAVVKPSLLSKWLKKDTDQSQEANTYPNMVQGLSPLTAPPQEPRLDSPAVRAFTSGSTGTPKVVSLNYRAIIHQARVMGRQTEIHHDSVLLSLFQFTQLGALCSGILLCFLSGASLCRPVRKFAYEHIPLLLDSIYKERVSHFYLVPTIMDLLLRYGDNLKEAFDTPDFKYFLCMAAMLPRSLWEEFETVTAKAVINSFGLTEANNLTYSGPNDPHRNMDSVGRCIDSRARIINEQGEIQAQGEQGELIIESSTLLQEYYGNAEETERVLKQGWFYTGDFATIDKHSNIHIIGRIKDVIISGGYNIYPEEVNVGLREHHSVSEAYTLGYKSETWGEQVISCVVLKDNATQEAELIQFLRERFSEIKVPKRIFHVQQLPMNARGKIDRQAVLALVSQHMEPKQLGSSEDYRQQVFLAAADIFMVDVKSLKMSSHYSDTPGWDSLGHMMLIAAIEKLFDFKVPPLEVLKIQTLGDLIEMVKEKQGLANQELEQSF